MLSRRAVVGKLAVGVAGGAVALAAGVGRATAAVPQRAGARRSETGEPALAGPTTTELGGPGETLQGPIGVTDLGPQLTESATPPWELLRPLAQGTALPHGWQVAGLSGVADGVCVLTLRNARGREHRVHLCRNDGTPQGLVYTEHLDLVVMNGGQGDLPTEEGLAQAVAEVAHVLAANERPSLVTELLPQRERAQRFASAVDRRLR